MVNAITPPPKQNKDKIRFLYCDIAVVIDFGTSYAEETTERKFLTQVIDKHEIDVDYIDKTKKTRPLRGLISQGKIIK